MERITVEAPSLTECLQKAAELLGVKEDLVGHDVFQFGKKGILGIGAQNFVIFAWIKMPSANAGADKKKALSSTIATELTLLELSVSELKKLDVLKEDDIVFNEMLANFDDLDDDIKQELRGICDIPHDETAKKIEKTISKHGELFLAVSDDRMQVLLSVFPAEGKGTPVSISAIMEAVTKKGVVCNINYPDIEAKLTECNQTHKPFENLVIGNGIKPIRGVDGSFELLYEKDQQSGQPALAGSQWNVSVNANIINVKKGQSLARVIPPTKGTPGTDVLGRMLPGQDGIPAQVQTGNNVRFNKTTLEFTSEIDGAVEFKNNILYVKNLYIIDGNLTVEVGNVDFEGNVYIKGSVCDGLTVKARENIDIQGTVEGATIISKNGTIKISDGIAGRDRCYISAAKDVYAKFIENGVVYAGHKIVVAGSVLHSRIVAGDTVSVMQGKGMIAGGVVKAGNKIEAIQLGSKGEPLTVLKLGIEMAAQQEIEKLEQKISALRQTYMQINLSLEKLVGTANKIDRLSDDTKAKFNSLKKKLVVIKYSERKLIKERDDLELNQLKEGRGKLLVHGRIYPKVTVEMGFAKFFSRQEYTNVSMQFDQEKHEIAISKMR